MELSDMGEHIFAAQRILKQRIRKVLLLNSYYIESVVLNTAREPQGTATNNCKGPQRTERDYCKIADLPLELSWCYCDGKWRHPSVTKIDTAAENC